MRGKPFALLGVNTDHKLERALSAVKTNRLPFRSWSDGSPDGPICRHWNVRAFPTWFILDPRGVIHVRDAVEELAEQQIRELLGAPPAASPAPRPPAGAAR